MDTIKIEDFAKVELLVVTVTAAEPIEKSNKLVKLTVDDGTPEPRTVLAGIKEHVGNLDWLVGIQVVIVGNLEPRTMMGVESRGMVVVAATADKTNLQLLSPRNFVTPGSRIG